MRTSRETTQLPPRINRGTVAAVALCAALGSLAGCAQKDTVYHDISLNRAMAYQSWLNQRKQQDGDEAVLRGPLTRERCVNVAMDHNKDIAAVTWDKEKAAGRITEAYSMAYPNLSLESKYARFDQAPMPGLDKNGYGLAATISQPLYRGGAVGAGVRAATIYSYMADEKIRETVQNITFEVNKAYYDILLAGELLRVTEQAVALSKTHHDDVAKRKEQGVASDYDVLRARVEVTNYEAEMIQNRNRLHLLKSSFYRLLGVSQESDAEFTDTFQYEPVEASLEDAVNQAYAGRAELLQAELGLKLSQEGLNVAKAERWPKADAFFTESYSNPDPHSTPGWGDGWTAGVAMRFPIFDGFRARGLIRQAKADIEKSRVQRSAAEEGVLLEIKQAMLSLDDARSFVESQKANVERAEQGLKLVEAGYREGVNTDLEVRDARQALLRAQSLHYQAIHQHQVAALALKKAIGALLPQKPEATEGK